MAVIGRFNTLTVLRLTGHGAILDGHTDDGEGGDILLPTRLLPPDIAVGASVEVFVHFDSEDRVIATTQTPLAQVGDVAWLKIVAENDAGIFLDWGLAKDLMLPWNEVPREQKIGLEPGRSVLVMVFQDSSGRIAASARLDDFLAREAEGFNEGDKVSLLIGDRTDLGVRAVVNNRYWGLVHNNELFGNARKGERRDGWVKTLRSDLRLNIALTPPGPDKIDSAAQGLSATMALWPLLTRAHPRPSTNYSALAKRYSSKRLAHSIKTALSPSKMPAFASFPRNNLEPDHVTQRPAHESRPG